MFPEESPAAGLDDGVKGDIARPTIPLRGAGTTVAVPESLSPDDQVPSLAPGTRLVRS